MPIDWIKSHSGYIAFAVLWIIVLAARQATKSREARRGPTAAKWTAVFLSLIAGAALASFVTGVAGLVMVCVVISGLLAAAEIAVVASAEAREGLRCEAEAMESLLNTEQKLHLHFELTPLGAMELDLEGRFVEWNTAAERIFGFSRQDVIGKNFIELIVPDFAREKIEAVWHAALKGSTDSARMNENRTREGRIILCEWSHAPIRDNHGNVTGIATLCEDITEKHRAAREIENLAAFPRYNPNPVMQFSEEGELVYCNESAEEMARTLGKPRVREILPSDVTAVVRECLENGGIQVKRETKINSRTISWTFSRSRRCIACIVTPPTSQTGLISSSSSGNRKRCNPWDNWPPGSRTISTTS